MMNLRRRNLNRILLNSYYQVKNFLITSGLNDTFSKNITPSMGESTPHLHSMLALSYTLQYRIVTKWSEGPNTYSSWVTYTNTSRTVCNLYVSLKTKDNYLTFVDTGLRTLPYSDPAYLNYGTNISEGQYIIPNSKEDFRTVDFDETHRYNFYIGYTDENDLRVTITMPYDILFTHSIADNKKFYLNGIKVS